LKKHEYDAIHGKGGFGGKKTTRKLKGRGERKGETVTYHHHL
jgi:hypothetical protein